MADKKYEIVTLLSGGDAADTQLGWPAGAAISIAFNDSIAAWGGYEMPYGARITGGYWSPAPAGNPVVVPDFVEPPETRRKSYLLRIALRHQQAQGRFPGKEKVHEMTQIVGGEGWTHVVNGNEVVRVFFGVTKKVDAAGQRLKSSRSGPFLRVLRRGDPLADVRRPKDCLFVPLDYEYALRRGLLVQDPVSGEVCAATDYMFVDKGIFVRAVGPRNLHRSLLEPSAMLIRKEKWSREKPGDELPGMLGPIIVKFFGDEDFFVNCLAIWAMGAPQRVKNNSTAPVDRPSNGDNAFQRMHNRHVNVANPTADPIGNFDPNTGQFDWDTGDATEMYYAARRLGFDLPENDDSGTPQLNPWRDEQEAWINDALRTADQISERRMRKEFRRGHGGFKEVDKAHTDKSFYMQTVGWVQPWAKIGGVWQPDGAVMRYNAAEDAGILVFRYGFSPSGQPELAKWWMKAALEDVFQACVRLEPNRDRDPKPWKAMAENNPFDSTLGPDALYSLCQMFSEIAARCKEFDDKSRFLELMIAKGAKPKKAPPATADPEVLSRWNRIEKGTPAATVYGDPWQDMLSRARRDAGGAAYFVVQLEGIWQETKDMVYGRPGSIWDAILTEIRNPIHRGWWNELADLYEERVRALVIDEEVIYA